MKYRRLRHDELHELEPEFIRFLASNTVTADEWEKVKTNQPEQAEKLIELFSDIVFQKTLENIKYLQRRSRTELQTFFCESDKIHLRGLRIEGQSAIDFTKNQSPQEMIQQLQSSAAELQIYRAEKAYAKSREQELFDMMENGCLISKGEMYQLLDALKNEE